MSGRPVSHRANAPNLSHCACVSENIVQRLLILHCSSVFSCPYNHNILFSVLFRFSVTFKIAFIIEFLVRRPDFCPLPPKLIHEGESHDNLKLHVASGAAIFRLLLRRRVAFLHRIATCRPLFKP